MLEIVNSWTIKADKEKTEIRRPSMTIQFHGQKK